MSLRGFRVFGKTLEDGYFSVLVECTHTESFVLAKSGALLVIDKETGDNLKKSYAKFTDCYGLLGILRLCEGESYLILVTGVFSVGQLYNCDICKVTNVQFISLNGEATDLFYPRIADLQRFLSAGIFYYAYSTDKKNIFDLTVSSQKRRDGVITDHQFFWNRNLCFPFERYGIDPKQWLVQCLCGSVLVRTIYVGHRTAKVAIISRLSCERVGTRFNVRGVNDDGHVANFVETEQLITFESVESSFVQVRGSVPLFWEQPGINVGSHKVKLKPFEISMPALERHYSALQHHYGMVTSVNLLGHKEGERLLSNAFQTSLKSSSFSDLTMICFDYHSEMKQSKESVKFLLKKLDPIIEKCQFYHRNGDVMFRTQKGVIRTNCLDCLDRTNSVQALIGGRMLEQQLCLLAVEQYKANINGRFEEVLKDLWVKNGDQCSVIYAGTGALDGKSKLKDASRSIARTIQNNLMDSSKQESFDLLLLGHAFGNKVFDKASCLLPSVVIKGDYYFYECPEEIEAFVEREKEMCSVERLSVFAGTWNVNGGKNMYNVAFRHEQSLDAWIFPPELFQSVAAMHYDIIAIGLEEIVDLNAGNLMKASTTNQRVWRDGIKKSINDYMQRREQQVNNTANGGGVTNHRYVVLACEQLVGVCLIIFIRSHLLGRVRDLATGEVKTGMGGATGNKGSVVVRLTVNATSMCFVCSHFAAGQNEVANRNDDFQTTLRKVRFPMGRTISSHDVIIWLGDFNYRISLGGDEVKNAVRLERFDYLAQYDQLGQQRAAGNVFVHFKEGPLNFAPTYKYDTFSDDYDTSEKCRAPAWTDRVLWQDPKALVRLLHYGRSELKTSDHRPVCAIFYVDTLKVVWEKCEEVINDVVCSMGPPDATILCSVSGAACNGHDDVGGSDASICGNGKATNVAFEKQLVSTIFDKLAELSIPTLLTKIENGNLLYVVLQNGVDALASLSMDGVRLDAGDDCGTLRVRLKSADWAEHYGAKLAALFRAASEADAHVLHDASIRHFWTDVNVDLDDDDEDAASAELDPATESCR